MIASKHGNITCLELLLQYRAEVNVIDKQGNTPLMISAQKGYFEICRLLTENGADPYICDNSGKNSIEKAKDLKIITLLQKHSKYRRKNKRKIKRLMTQLFNRIDNEFWKTNKLGVRIEERIKEKVNELGNRIYFRNSKILESALNESHLVYKQKILENCKKWTLATTLQNKLDLDEYVEKMSQSELIKFDITSVYDKNYDKAVMAAKNRHALAFKNLMKNEVSKSIEKKILSAKQTIFHGISNLLRDFKEDLVYESEIFVSINCQKLNFIFNKIEN